jgi:hypothetical protein
MDQATRLDQVMLLQDHPTHHPARSQLHNANSSTRGKRPSRGLVDACAEVLRRPLSGRLGHFLGLGESAVDEEFGSVDEDGRLRSEEYRGFGDVIRLADASERDL